MTPIQIVALIKKENPKLLANVQEKQAARFIREAWVLINKQIEAVEEGVVRAPGLGSFKIRQIEQEKEGKKTTVKKVIFKAAKPSAIKEPKSGFKKKA